MLIDRRSVVGGLASLAAVPKAAAKRGVTGPTFVRTQGGGPVIMPDPHSIFFCPMRNQAVKWRALHAFNPAAAVHDGNVYLLFRAEDDSGDMRIGGHTSRLGLARSADGINFEVLPSPVLYPTVDDQREAEWTGGCEDPRLAIRDDGLFVCTYTQFSGHAVRLGVASSSDLLFWSKHGSAFAGTRYAQLVTKSAAVVHREINDRLVAASIDGRYWMLFGEGTIYAAHSTDLIRWTPVETSPGVLKPVMAPRVGFFDSALVEGGPPPILTEAGIVMLYNGKNAQIGGDQTRPALEYAGGRALLDARDPTRVLERADRPFFFPQQPWERSGQYAAGTTFIEGLVRHRGRWLLYYGAADSVVGVAISTDLHL